MMRLISRALISALFFISPQLASAPVFINEIHYDNVGADVSEAVELAGVADTDLSGWYLQFYNGTDGLVYTTLPLSGTVPDEGDGFGAISFYKKGLQNGAPDGLALIDNNAAVVSFLSYEGVFEAVDGYASGMHSSDIGISESASTDKGLSLQLSGVGQLYEDFTWILDSASFSYINSTQGLSLSNDKPVTVPLPGVITLLLPMLFFVYRRFKS